jgi:DNA-binding beta-propeller fold protein YncE
MRWRAVTAALMLSVAVAVLFPRAAAAQAAAPTYQVDGSWPKPLPNEWTLGGLGGVCVDHLDHVLILNRQDNPAADRDAGRIAPPILEIDSSGSLINSWGDSQFLDPRLHSCHADTSNDLWVASAPSGMVQKYSHDGRKLLMQIGTRGVFDSSDGTVKGRPLNSDAARFFMPASIYVDPANGDVMVADGEGAGGNRRVAVMDRSGAFLRQWQPEGMNTVHCLVGSHEGFLYVCNREHGRIQVYDKEGRLIRHIEVPGQAAGTGGSAVALAFSPDANQQWIFVINQNDTRIDVLDRRSGKVVSSFGRAGQRPGEFDQPHGIAVDSKGNVYVAENRGRRVQKFVPRP